MNFENREYNKPSQIEYEGTLTKNRNQRPTCDQKFLDWCVANAERFSSYYTMAKALGLDGRAFQRLIEDYNITLTFDSKAAHTPKLYQDYDWLYNQIVTLNKSRKQVAEENGWTVRVLEKWMGILGINRRTYQDLKQMSDKQRDLIKFSLLGDGCVSDTGFFIVSHSEKQKDYLYWKYEMLKDLCSHEPTRYDESVKIINGKEVNCEPYYRFNTRKLKELFNLREMPIEQIVNDLDEFGLSIWMLDDASRDASWKLCIAAYPEETRTFIVNYFKDKGFLSAKVRLYDTRYVEFNADDSRKIDAIILRNIPHNLDIIQYKIINNSRIKSPRRGNNG